MSRQKTGRQKQADSKQTGCRPKTGRQEADRMQTENRQTRSRRKADRPKAGSNRQKQSRQEAGSNRQKQSRQKSGSNIQNQSRQEADNEQVATDRVKADRKQTVNRQGVVCVSLSGVLGVRFSRTPTRPIFVLGPAERSGATRRLHFHPTHDSVLLPPAALCRHWAKFSPRLPPGPCCTALSSSVTTISYN